MKILLFGEFSGLFTSLKEGLVAEGHDVFLASSGDGYKDYPADFRYDVKIKRAPLLFRFILAVLNIFRHRKLLRGYDAVLIVSPMLFHHYIILNRIVYSYLIRNNKKVFLSGTGLTPISLTFWYDSNKKYHKYAEGLMGMESYKNYYNNSKLIQWEDYLHKKVNGYIPIWYEYAEPFRNYANTLSTIRIPINSNNFEFRPNVVKEKIVFFHGKPSRPEAKGTAYIEAAFNKMKAKYQEKAEFIIAGGLPFNEYMDLITRTNVILDDANSYSIAMNGLFSLAKGKIVMGGAEPEGNKELCLSNNPVINIVPDVEQICDKIEELISNKDTIEELGLQGRKFVEEYHDYRKVAKMYVQTFEKY